MSDIQASCLVPQVTIRNKTGNARNTKAHLRNNVCHGKAISIRYSERGFVALLIHHAHCMRRIIRSSMTCLLLPYSFLLSHKEHDLKKVTKQNLFGFFYKFFISKLIHRDIINVHTLSCKLPFILVILQ